MQCTGDCFLCRQQVILSLVLAAEYVFDFVLVELLHLVTSRTKIFAGVKLSRLLGHHAAYGCGHGKTAVRVDVDLANGALGSLAELFFGNTDSVGKLAAVFVDLINILLGY